MQLKQDTVLQNGKYRIIRVLGQGGFGITYLAENVFFGKTVAIKEFFPKNFCGRDNTSHLTLGTANNAETVEKLRNRFMKEAKNIAKLDHPGIVKIHDIFEENNTAYYVMDYIDGENLNEMVKRNGPLSETKAVEYIRKVGDALDYIHSRNMTHFDVKPANIVVRKSDDMPILIDFGLSKQYDIQGDATSTLMQGVSNGYSPIELYNMGSITTFSPQTDVYSLGATFYFLLTGNTPPTSAQLFEEGLNLPTDISEANQSAIRKAMAPNRGERTRTINLFLDGLNNFEHHKSISDHNTKPTSYNNLNTRTGLNRNEDTIYINPISRNSETKYSISGSSQNRSEKSAQFWDKKLKERQLEYDSKLNKIQTKRTRGYIFITLGLIALICTFIFIGDIRQPFWGVMLVSTLFIIFGGVGYIQSSNDEKIELRIIAKDIEHIKLKIKCN